LLNDIQQNQNTTTTINNKKASESKPLTPMMNKCNMKKMAARNHQEGIVESIATTSSNHPDNDDALRSSTLSTATIPQQHDKETEQQKQSNTCDKCNKPN
jgi:hypothetical protein